MLDQIAHDPTGKKGDALFGYDRVSESDQQVLLEMLGPLRAPTSDIHLSIESIRSSGRFSIVIVRVPWNKETGSGELHPVLLVNDVPQRLPCLPITPAIPIYAKERARLESIGRPLDDFDLLIGATAVHHGLALVTNNTRHFERMQDLTLEDWTR